MLPFSSQRFTPKGLAVRVVPCACPDECDTASVLVGRDGHWAVLYTGDESALAVLTLIVQDDEIQEYAEHLAVAFGEPYDTLDRGRLIALSLVEQNFGDLACGSPLGFLRWLRVCNRSTAARTRALRCMAEYRENRA